MRPKVLEPNVQLAQPPADNLPECRPTHRCEWCFQGQEDLTIWRARPHLFQVSQDGLAYGMRERVRLCPSRFWSDEVDHLLFPVKIFQPKSDDLTGAYSINTEKHQDRAVADIYRLITISAREQSLDVFP